jgi:hypothetical protein
MGLKCPKLTVAKGSLRVVQLLITKSCKRLLYGCHFGSSPVALGRLWF